MCTCRLCFQVQQFKQDPRPTTCLHSVFNVRTGDEVLSYEEYGHLQVRRHTGLPSSPQRRLEASQCFTATHERSRWKGISMMRMAGSRRAGLVMGLNIESTSKKGSWKGYDVRTT